MVVTQEDKSIELLDVDPQETEDDGAVVVLDSKRKGKRTVIKTLTRQTYFLPVFGLVDPEKLKPDDLVGVNKDSHFRPTEQYSDIGGLDRQIQKLIEAVVLPTTHTDKFKNLRIHPPKSTYLKLAGHCPPNCSESRSEPASQPAARKVPDSSRCRSTPTSATSSPVPSRRPKSLPTVPSLRVSFQKPFPLVRPQMLSHAVRNATLCYTSTDRAKAPASSTEQSPPQSLPPHSPNQLDTRVDTTIGLPAHIDFAGGLNPPLASNRTLFTDTSFSLATSPSIRSTSSTSLLNREPSSSSSPFTNPELPITLPSSSPNVTLFPPTMVNVPSPSHVLCFLVVILPQHTCVVVVSAGVCNAAGFLTATAQASNTRAWFSELVSSSSMPGSGWACGNGCSRIVRVVEVRPAGTASSTVLPSSPAFAS
ncbi:26S protease regulatory subunit 6a [Culex quinquefasciatus]|uniref:26S protease regulatory subunit 6a n=1 Tax=Culex quinquefasciatus TaxID=7176 RepID=B0X2E6_CULQU|nr:26S protease regulatory subunit 6a [Culex quinquefasciatus]|eukprot:XP_001863818.1 26S protease regulatory subunit 6a [Culex quinquefasciatus]